MKTRRPIRRATVAAVFALALLSGCADKPDALIASAKEHLAKSDRDAAVIQLKNALQISPDLAEARFLLGKTLLDTGDIAAAEKELRKAREFGYSNEQVIPVLARALMLQGEFKKIIDEFAGVDLTSPASKADLQTTLGEVRLAMGDVEAARRALSAAVTAVPDYPPALLGQARLKAGTGDLPGALMLLETALVKSPTLTDGWQLKGDILRVQGQNDDAIAAYRQAVATRSNYIPAHSSIVSVLLRLGRIDEASKQFETLKKVAPKNPQTLYLQALLALREKNYAAARDAIQLHLKAAPGNLAGLLLGAQIDYQLGSTAQAEAALATVLQRAPKQAFARRLLVRAYLRGGKPGKALDAMKPLLDQAQQDSDTLYLAGEVYAQNNDAATAARYFEKASALDPKSTAKRATLALSHVAMGESERGLAELEAVAAEDSGVRVDIALIVTNVRQRKFDAALAAVAALEKKQPDKPLAHNLRGEVLLAKRDVTGARRSFERALAIDPANFPATASLARLDVLERKPEDAKKRFENVLVKDPKNVQALLALAALRAQAGGTTDEVAIMIGKAIAANPADPSPRLALAYHYLLAKEPRKAAAAAQEGVVAFPDRPDFLDAAARAYRAAGDPNQAISAYNKLIQLRPDSPLPLMRLAEIQIAAKDNAAATESLRKALALKPDLVEARSALMALDISSGRTDKALASARDVQKRRPKESVGYILEGNIHLSKKAWTDAAATYRAGLKQAGTSELAFLLYGALSAGGKGTEADGFAATWLREHPKDRGFRQDLAQVAIGKKDYASAMRQYNALLEIDQYDVLALNNLAWVAGQMKDPKALGYAERAYKISPGHPAILDTYGMLLVEKGDTARGVELLQKAIAVAPNVAGIRLNLARALIRAGQKDAAKKELETLAKLGDKFPAQAEVAKLTQSL